LTTRHVVLLDVQPGDELVVVDRAGHVIGTPINVDAETAEDWAKRALAGELPDAAVLDPARLERELHDARRLAELHFEHDITADFVARADGRLLDCNPVFLRVFGLGSLDEARGHSLAELFPSVRQWEIFLQALSAKGRLHGHRVELKTLSGAPVHALQNVALDVDSAGSPERIRGYISDRTAERQLEEELFRFQRLDAMGRLAGGVAHDFNNLLTVILNYVELLDRSSDATSSTRQMVAEVRHAGERAADLTRRLLAFGRRQSLRARAFDLTETVNKMLPLVRSVLGETIDLDLVSSDVENIVSGDSGQIEQVLMNLVVNARDAMPMGGTLRIEVEQVFVDANYRRSHPWAKPGRYVLLSVSDTGSGMPDDVKEHLFEPFFTTKASGHGTGLGLASAYGIVQAHGGMIHAYSEEAVGTTLKVYLPVSVRPASSVGPNLLRRPKGGTETILVAEDEASVRRVLAELLRERGYVVIEAASGEEALALFAEHAEIDLAILDVVMPGIGGIAAYQSLRAARPTLPIVLSSGYSGELASDDFAADFHAEFVPKPYSPDALLARIRAALDAVDAREA
jgi:two-component system cell cycle sensor histidine kinase/response regulator CckA